MISFFGAEKLAASYPIYEKCNFLNDEIFNELVADFPLVSFLNNANIVMGGRKRIASDEIDFYRFLDKSKAWSNFYNYVNSSEFIRRVFDFFGEEDTAIFNKVGSDPVSLNRNFFKRKAILRRYFPLRIANGLHKLFGAAPWKREIFVHFDISSAEAGYQREIHRDTDQRLAVFLVYFSDAEEVGGVGGEFGVHSYKIPPPREVHELQPDPSKMKTDFLIKPKKNLGVLFLSTYNAYHSVPKMMENKSPRNFIYVGISLREKII